MDYVFEALKDSYAVGEELTYRTSRHKPVVDVVVTQVNKLPDGTVQYTIKPMFGPETEARLTVLSKNLFRVRNAFSKILLRQFLRESCTHTVSGPWTVNADKVEEYELKNAKALPDSLFIEPETGAIKRKFNYTPKPSAMEETGEVRPKWPMEDSQISCFPGVKTHIEMDTASVPVPVKEFTVPKETVSDLLLVWDFLFVFAQPLKLYPFTLDDFEVAMRHSDSERACALLDAVWTTLLKSACDRKKELVVKEAKTKMQHKTTGIFSSDVVDHTRGSADAVIKTEQSLNEKSESMEIDGDDEVIHDADENGHTINAGMSVPLENLIAEQWWLWKPAQQTWEDIIPGFLLQAGNTHEIPDLVEIITTLANSKVVVAPASGLIGLENGISWRKEADPAAAYYDLSLTNRLHIMSFLIANAVAGNSEIRAYIDQCTASIVDLKREKRELETRKRELNEKNTVMKVGEQESEQASRKTARSQSIDLDQMDRDSDGDDAANDSAANESENEVEAPVEESAEIQEMKNRVASVTSETSRVSRKELIQLQQSLKEAQNFARVADLKKARAEAQIKNALKREKAEQRRKLDAEMDQTYQREELVDRELRKFSGGVGVRALGRDRFWNKYWWFDGYGSGVAGIMEHGVQTGKTSHLSPFGTGKLFVEGSGKQPFLGQVSGITGRQAGQRRVMIFRDPSYHKSDDPFVMIRDQEGQAQGVASLGDNWLAAGEWAYYETTAQIDELLCWLNPRGVRESNLKNTLTKYYDLITFNLEKRQEEIEKAKEVEESDAKGRRPRVIGGSANTDPCMTYKNRWAH